MIFESTDNRYPTVEELVLCDLFRNIDLREMRGPSVSVSCYDKIYHWKLKIKHDVCDLITNSFNSRSNMD